MLIPSTVAAETDLEVDGNGAILEPESDELVIQEGEGPGALIDNTSGKSGKSASTKAASSTTITVLSTTYEGITSKGKGKSLVGRFKATEKGERYSISYTTSRSCIISGNIEATIKKKVIVNLGFNYTKERNVSVMGTSSSLKKDNGCMDINNPNIKNIR